MKEAGSESERVGVLHLHRQRTPSISLVVIPGEFVRDHDCDDCQSRPEDEDTVSDINIDSSFYPYQKIVVRRRLAFQYRFSD